MEKVKDFDEVKEKMINPIQNPNFYALILTYGPMPYSLCHTEDYGQFDWFLYQDMLTFVLKLWVDNEIDKLDKSDPEYNQKLVKLQKRRNQVIRISKKENIEEFKEFIVKNEEFIQGSLKRETEGKKQLDTAYAKLTSNHYWFYFKSHTLQEGKCKKEIHADDVMHRLYLTVDAKERVLFSTKLIEKCNKRGLPYHFKIHVGSSSIKKCPSDTIVIYLETEEQVVEYINIINEIIEENKELKDHIHKPSPHLGIVSEYIGYGFEPDNKGKDRGDQKSYSELIKASHETAAELRPDLFKSVGLFNSTCKRIIKLMRDNYKNFIILCSEYNLYSGEEKIDLPTIEELDFILAPHKEEELDKANELMRKTLTVFFRLSWKDKTPEINSLISVFRFALIINYPDIPEMNMFDIEWFDKDDCLSRLEQLPNGKYTEARIKLQEQSKKSTK